MASVFTRAALALMLCAGSSTAAHALPAGGIVQSGSATFSTYGSIQLTISQSSKYAIIDWNNFSIGNGALVSFLNGTGATLNRVTGKNISRIDGSLYSTGSVYLINPNGVIIGKKGVVTVSGDFVASTQNMSDQDFLNPGTQTLSGNSTASIINLGKIGSLGGDVVLVASTVTNKGTAGATQGDVGLLAGYTVQILDTAATNGKFVVQVGGAGTSVKNTGLIAATVAELRANGGNVYALAGYTGGVIDAVGVTKVGGQIFLTAGDGNVYAHGTLSTTVGDKTGGDVLTEGQHVNVANSAIFSGDWTIEQPTFLVTKARATRLDDGLIFGDVTVDTTRGDLYVANSLLWLGTKSLTLSSFKDVTLDNFVTIDPFQGAAVNVIPDNTERGVGTLNLGVGAKIE